MPTSRYRSFTDQYVVSGTRYHRIFGTSVRNKTMGPYGTCDDVVGNQPNANNLLIVRKTKSTLVLDGEQTDGSGVVRKYTHAPIQYDPPIPSYPFSEQPLELELSGWRTEILARTNVNVAGTNLPQFVAEFGDYAGLIRSTKQLWSDVFRLAALGYVTWRWVIRPFMADLRTMAQFGENVNRRITELLVLKEKGFRRQRVALANESVTSTGSFELIEAQDFLLQAQRVTKSTLKVWGSVQWNLAEGVKLPPTLQGIEEFSKAIEVGFTTHNALRTLWELTPWSWFIDWFVDISEFIDAHDGTIPMFSSNCCVMRTIRAKSRWVNMTAPPSWITVSGDLSSEVSEKQRYVVSGPAFPDLGMPFLKPAAHAILGALAIVKTPSVFQHGKTVRKAVVSFLKDANSRSVENVQATFKTKHERLVDQIIEERNLRAFQQWQAGKILFPIRKLHTRLPQ